MNAITRTTRIATAAISLATFALSAFPATAATAPAKPKPTIVLVHGAFADGSGWERVIPLLQKEGYKTIAVQNPLTSFEADVATTRRLINGQEGDVIAVGHSYGGAVISAAASGNPKVKGLVYIAAFAPDANEKLGALYGKFGPSPLGSALQPDSAGFLYINPARFREVFAADMPAKEAAVMAAVQKPFYHDAFELSIAAPAWKQIPSWYMVATDDQAILAELQRFMAKRMGATTVEVKASHVPFLSKPKDVAGLILKAATAAK